MAQSARGDRGFAAEFAERVFDLKILEPGDGERPLPHERD